MLDFQGEKPLASILANLRAITPSTLLYVPMGIMGLYLVLQLIWGDGGYYERRNLQELIAKQKQEVAEFTKRNRDIYYRIQVLKTDNKAVEGQARDELGLIKPEESFYQVVTAVFDP